MRLQGKTEELSLLRHESDALKTSLATLSRALSLRSAKRNSDVVDDDVRVGGAAARFRPEEKRRAGRRSWLGGTILHIIEPF